MTSRLLSDLELPSGFVYPREFVRLVELELLELEPWWILTDDLLRDKYEGLKDRYPKRRLVPFARRQDNDDVACWDLTQGNVSIVHDYASPGWESRHEALPDFTSWLHRAVDDMLEF